MSPKLSKILKITLPIVLGVFLIAYSLSKVSVNELLVYFKNANYWWILLGAVLGLLSHLSRAYRWLFMLEPLGYKVKLYNSVMAVFAAYLINYTIPRAGEVARVSVLTTYEGVPFDKGFGTVVAERIADLILMMSIIVVTLFLQFDFIFNFFLSKFNLPKLILIFAGCVVLGVIFLFYIKSSQSKLAVKIRTFVLGLLEGVLSIFKMKKKWWFIGHTLFIWTMYVLMFYITTFAVKGLQPMAFGAILVGFISASFSIAATNGGIGSYPVAVYAAFTLFGIAQAPSIAFGWIMWSSQTLLLIICGSLSLLLLPIFNRKLKLK
ncbi:flippase-like domain-containing protein [Formosa sediminum]|uniref:Flippase-like domain-containing protein n=1 Tax=Formosa sediminum TaxID=2594004 RepID=A0A516GPF2_9FLAO|nr:lysylphosphatidylglycerol synthase transmembrane domain-containing protein [Formosa sediminum]QDO93401.1 flippase-like domain-containing protein [Formosa sediminum]